MPKRNFEEITGLDLFTRPEKVRNVRRWYISEKPTDTVLTNDDLDSILFEIPKAEKNEMLDIGYTKLQLKMKIVNKDGTALKDTGTGNDLVRANAKVAPINNTLHSIFDNVQVSLNHKVISSSNNMYTYISYLSDLLDKSQEEKDSYMTAQLWYENGAFNSTDPKQNSGFAKRAQPLSLIHI